MTTQVLALSKSGTTSNDTARLQLAHSLPTTASSDSQQRERPTACAATPTRTADDTEDTEPHARAPTLNTRAASVQSRTLSRLVFAIPKMVQRNLENSDFTWNQILLFGLHRQ